MDQNRRKTDRKSLLATQQDPCGPNSLREALASRPEENMAWEGVTDVLAVQGFLWLSTVVVGNKQER